MTVPKDINSIATASTEKEPSSLPSKRQRRRSSLEALFELSNGILRRSKTFPLTDDEDEGSDIALVPEFRRSSITPAEQEHIDEMLSQLSADELEFAARTNFEYLKSPCDTKRMDCATDMAKRYLRSKKDPVIALEKMRATIDFREHIDVDGLRLAFEDPESKYREPLKEQLSSKVCKVQGYDKEGRATYVFEPYLVRTHDTEWTIKSHVWTLERAVACSKAEDSSVNAVVNFNGFSATRHAPPIAVGQQFLTTLRSHYTGHVNQIFLIDAPTTFYCLWAVFKPFVGRKTKNKIHFISSNKQKQEVIGRLYSEDQATPWMLPNGQMDQPLDLDTYLETPFDRL